MNAINNPGEYEFTLSANATVDSDVYECIRAFNNREFVFDKITLKMILKCVDLGIIKRVEEHHPTVPTECFDRRAELCVAECKAKFSQLNDADEISAWICCLVIALYQNGVEAPGHLLDWEFFDEACFIEKIAMILAHEGVVEEEVIHNSNNRWDDRPFCVFYAIEEPKQVQATRRLAGLINEAVPATLSYSDVVNYWNRNNTRGLGITKVANSGVLSYLYDGTPLSKLDLVLATRYLRLINQVEESEISSILNQDEAIEVERGWIVPSLISEGDTCLGFAVCYLDMDRGVQSYGLVIIRKLDDGTREVLDINLFDNSHESGCEII